MDGEHRRTDEMLRVMSRILPNKLLLELGAGLIDGVPNFLNAEIENNELQETMECDKMSNL